MGSRSPGWHAPRHDGPRQRATPVSVAPAQGQGHLLLFLGLGLLTLLGVAPVSEADDDWSASYPGFDASRSEEGTLEVAKDRRIPSMASLMAILRPV